MDLWSKKHFWRETRVTEVINSWLLSCNGWKIKLEKTYFVTSINCNFNTSVPRFPHKGKVCTWPDRQRDLPHPYLCKEIELNITWIGFRLMIEQSQQMRPFRCRHLTSSSTFLILTKGLLYILKVCIFVSIFFKKSCQIKNFLLWILHLHL